MKNLQRVPDLPLEPACDAPPKPGLSLVPAPPRRPAPLLWVMYFAYFTFGLTGVVGTLTPDIITDFHLTRAAAGLIGTFTFLSVALFAMPSGALADRLGARRVILAGVALMALGCFMVSQSHTYRLVLAMIFAIGTGVTMLQTSGSPMIQQPGRAAELPPQFDLRRGLLHLRRISRHLLPGLSSGYGTSLAGLLPFVRLCLPGGCGVAGHLQIPCPRHERRRDSIWNKSANFCAIPSC